MLSLHAKAGALPFSRSRLKGGVLGRHRGGGPTGYTQAAHDDGLLPDPLLFMQETPGPSTALLIPFGYEKLRSG